MNYFKTKCSDDTLEQSGLMVGPMMNISDGPPSGLIVIGVFGFNLEFSSRYGQEEDSLVLEPGKR